MRIAKNLKFEEMMDALIEWIFFGRVIEIKYQCSLFILGD